MHIMMWVTIVLFMFYFMPRMSMVLSGLAALIGIAMLCAANFQ